MPWGWMLCFLKLEIMTFSIILCPICNGNGRQVIPFSLRAAEDNSHTSPLLFSELDKTTKGFFLSLQVRISKLSISLLLSFAFVCNGHSFSLQSDAHKMTKQVHYMENLCVKKQRDDFRCVRHNCCIPASRRNLSASFLAYM